MEKSKIGILTFHRAWNYGAVLQCYALQEILRKIGYDVYVINYKQPWTESIYKVLDVKKIRKLIFCPRSLFSYIFHVGHRLTQKRIFNNFVSNYLYTTSECDANSIPSDFEVYVIGSDQLWGLNCLGDEIDRVYMGDFAHHKPSKVIGYAISTNQESLDLIGTYKLKRYALNFDCLSFREKTMSDYFESLTNNRARVDLDPTLLSDSKIWDSIVNDNYSNQKYVLLYQIRKKQELIIKAKNIAKKNGWKVIDMSNMTYSVESFVSLIKYAQCIVTSSFHATVFSLIFRKRFYAVKLNDGLDARYVDLLNSISASEAIVDITFAPKVPPLLDYDKIQLALETIRKPSLEYLKGWMELDNDGKENYLLCQKLV